MHFINGITNGAIRKTYDLTSTWSVLIDFYAVFPAKDYNASVHRWNPCPNGI
jgi:hypothetical protein